MSTGLNWEEMKKHWDQHDKQHSNVNFSQDPKGLTNVCIPAAPFWLNQYHDTTQRWVYQKLFNLIPEKKSARAIDIGCGAGRWCVFLSESGYDATGLDLQNSLIEKNRQRFPHIRFLNVPIQEFVPDHLFSLASSVTVIQHNPPEEQKKIISKLRSWLEPGGYAIILENVSFECSTVFPHSVFEWRNLFEKSGFQCLYTQPYDVSPCMRMMELGASVLKAALATKNNRPSADGGTVLKREEKDSNLRRIYRTFERVSGALDLSLERAFVSMQAPLPGRHCGYLFKAI